MVNSGLWNLTVNVINNKLDSAMMLICAKRHLFDKNYF